MGEPTTSERRSFLNRRRSDKTNQQESRQRHIASEVVRRKKLQLIVDGYNLMHVSRFRPSSQAEGELRRCREGLLSLLASHLPASRYTKITIVFDSDNAPKHLPDRSSWKHLNVVFARQENSADDLIVQLIRQHPTPSQLVVVSSDHRIHVAAGRRVTAIDSDVWLDAVLDFVPEKQPPRRSGKREEQKDGVSKPTFTKEELEEFSAAMNEQVQPPPMEDSKDLPDDEASIEFENPFPEGYFDDLDET